MKNSQNFKFMYCTTTLTMIIINLYSESPFVNQIIFTKTTGVIVLRDRNNSQP